MKLWICENFLLINSGMLFITLRLTVLRKLFYPRVNPSLIYVLEVHREFYRP